MCRIDHPPPSAVQIRAIGCSNSQKRASLPTFVKVRPPTTQFCNFKRLSARICKTEPLCPHQPPSTSGFAKSSPPAVVCSDPTPPLWFLRRARICKSNLPTLVDTGPTTPNPRFGKFKPCCRLSRPNTPGFANWLCFPHVELPKPNQHGRIPMSGTAPPHRTPKPTQAKTMTRWEGAPGIFLFINRLTSTHPTMPQWNPAVDFKQTSTVFLSGLPPRQS